jgi:hypothetical protein
MAGLPASSARFLVRAEVSASAAVSAVVALPHGLSRLLVFGFLVVAVALTVVFGRTQDDLARAVTAWKRQCLEDHIESVARLVRERRADREPKVVLSLALHDGERTICAAVTVPS